MRSFRMRRWGAARAGEFHVFPSRARKRPSSRWPSGTASTSAASPDSAVTRRSPRPAPAARAVPPRLPSRWPSRGRGRRGCRRRAVDEAVPADEVRELRLRLAVLRPARPRGPAGARPDPEERTPRRSRSRRGGGRREAAAAAPRSGWSRTRASARGPSPSPVVRGHRAGVEDEDCGVSARTAARARRTPPGHRRPATPAPRRPSVGDEGPPVLPSGGDDHQAAVDEGRSAMPHSCIAAPFSARMSLDQTRRPLRRSRQFRIPVAPSAYTRRRRRWRGPRADASEDRLVARPVRMRPEEVAAEERVAGDQLQLLALLLVKAASRDGESGPPRSDLLPPDERGGGGPVAVEPRIRSVASARAENCGQSSHRAGIRAPRPPGSAPPRRARSRVASASARSATRGWG